MKEEQLHNIRHSLSHLMTMAVLELYPDAGLGVGPVIDDGFYQDYDLPESISEDIFPKLEKRMRQLIEEKIDFVQHTMDFDEALAMYKDDPYKTELIEELRAKGEKNVSFFKSGDFENLCLGPHVENTSEIRTDSFKLTKVAGAYWRGDEKNKMLTRIYGVAFENRKELKQYEVMMEEAQKRDHRKLGSELDLFYFSELVGAGLPLFTEKGTILRDQLTDFIWELMEPYGYTRVTIPHIAKSDLYKVSGHWDKFADDIFHVRSQKTDQVFVMKPMNCPHHTQIFSARPRSYKDLPIRMSEVTAVYRDENTGQLQGLSRVRSITQDDAHVFCTLDQINDEVKALFDIIQKFYAPFGMSLQLDLSLSDPNNPEKYLGERSVWEKSEGILRDVLGNLGQEFAEVEGEAAFYGPKVDFRAKDAIGRTWQLATIQLDFNLPERFELEYTNDKGEKERPVMIHRAILGSVERFLSVIIEHYAGNFPVWLSPVQVHLVPVSEKHVEGAREIMKDLKAAGIRVEIDEADETVGNKIRKASKGKAPYVVVVGDKELSGDEWMIRVRGEKDQVQMSREVFVEKVKKEILERS
ncbi:MAG: threonine--tRNA ligase [Candidatus Magasanikbacteria bacterium]